MKPFRFSRPGSAQSNPHPGGNQGTSFVVKRCWYGQLCKYPFGPFQHGEEPSREPHYGRWATSHLTEFQKKRPWQERKESEEGKGMEDVGK